MAELIPYPVLDSRDGEQIAAEAIAHVSGGLTVGYLDSKIKELYALRALVATGALPLPICQDLTDANNSSPHVALLEAQALLADYCKYTLNQLPEKVRIEFANLFVHMREATPATTTLEFTATGNQPVTISAGTTVKTSDNKFIFTTDVDLTILNPALDPLGRVAATRTTSGPTLLAPNTLTELGGALADIEAVTNPDQVDSGAAAETVTAALQRAQNYQRRGERLVSALDVEQAIMDEVLFGNGIVKAFPLYQFPDWETRRPGYVTVVVMTRAGNPISNEVRLRLNTLLKQRVGHILFEIIDPQYVDFTVTASIIVEGLTSSDATKAAVEKNLRDFYAARSSNFGKRISRSEIIQHIEDTPGVERIATEDDEPILDAPLADINLAPYEMPRLGIVTINVV